MNIRRSNTQPNAILDSEVQNERFTMRPSNTQPNAILDLEVQNGRFTQWVNINNLTTAPCNLLIQMIYMPVSIMKNGCRVLKLKSINV